MYYNSLYTLYAMINDDASTESRTVVYVKGIQNEKKIYKI